MFEEICPWKWRNNHGNIESLNFCETIGGKSCWMWSVGEVLLCKVRHLNCNLMMLQPLLAQCAPPGSEHEQTCWTWDILEAVRIFHTSNRSPFHVVPKKVWKLRVISAPVEPSRVSNGTYAFEPLRSSKRCWEIHENPQIFLPWITEGDIRGTFKRKTTPLVLWIHFWFNFVLICDLIWAVQKWWSQNRLWSKEV